MADTRQNQAPSDPVLPAMKPLKPLPPLVAFGTRNGRSCRWTLALVIVALGILLPQFAGISELYRVQQILFYVMVGFGLNIGLGYSGQFAVAQPVVYGVAAYTAGVMSVHWGISFWITLPAAVGIACFIGFLLSAPGFRLQGWYLAVTTFFAALVFPGIVDLFTHITGGTNGLSGIGPFPWAGLTLGASARLYWILLGLTLVMFLGMYNLSRSTFGVILRGVRDAPRAAQACGINVSLSKAFVSVLSAFPVAIAGWAFAHATPTIATADFTLNLAIVIVAGVVLGGMGTVWGPVVGTFLVELIELWIGPFSAYNTLLVGGAVVFFAIAMPGGIVAAWRGLWNRIFIRLEWSGPRRTGVPDVAAGSREETMAGLSADLADDRMAGLTAEVTEVAAPAEHDGDTSAHAGEAGETVLVIEDVHKRFSGVVVLDGVDLEIRRGEVVGLIGPNGSGKTTLLNAVTGHIKADSGKIELFGQTIRGRSPHVIAARGIRRTFQVPRLIGELSVIENIRLGLLGGQRQEVFGSIFTLPGYRRRKKRQLPRIEEVCELVGLDRTAWHQRVDSLPLGTRRVVEVGRAVVAGPAVVCLDEPGAGLGGDALVVLGRVMRRVADAGSAVVVIEHNLDFVRGVTDRVVEMQDGRVVDIPEGGQARAAVAGRAL